MTASTQRGGGRGSSLTSPAIRLSRWWRWRPGVIWGGPGLEHGVVDDAGRDGAQLAVLLAAQATQQVRGVIGATALAAPQNPDRPVDHRPMGQHGLQLEHQTPGLVQDLGVGHRDARRGREQFTGQPRVLVEGIAAVGIEVHHPEHTGTRPQRDRERAVDGQRGYSAGSARPPVIGRH